jgi:AcrR family transcriptional regulator
MPRPRKASDDDIFMAAQRAMTRLGPSELTLAAIADEAGVTAGALVQRFGSKRGLFLAAMKQFSTGTAEMFAALRAGKSSPLAAIRAYADCMAGLAPSPEGLARNLAYLQMDFTDPEFRTYLVAQGKDVSAELAALVRAAIGAGELSKEARPAELARTISALISGSMMSWACYQEGTAAAWIRADLDAILRPYRPARRRRLS